MLGNKKNFNWKTLPEMFFKQSEINSSKPLLWFKKENRYHPLTWRNIENKPLNIKHKNKTDKSKSLAINVSALLHTISPGAL